MKGKIALGAVIAVAVVAVGVGIAFQSNSSEAAGTVVAEQQPVIDHTKPDFDKIRAANGLPVDEAEAANVEEADEVDQVEKPEKKANEVVKATEKPVTVKSPVVKKPVAKKSSGKVYTDSNGGKYKYINGVKYIYDPLMGTWDKSHGSGSIGEKANKATKADIDYIKKHKIEGDM